MTRIAYIVSAYKLPEQVVRLVHRLTRESDWVLLHVDRKAHESVHRHLAGELVSVPSVLFLKRHTCHWGGFGHVAASLEGIATLLTNDIPYDVVILLTGQDYPLKPVAYIREFFRNRPRELFVEHFPLPRPEWEEGGLNRVDFWHVHLSRGHAKIPKPALRPGVRRAPGGLRLFGGSSYWCLSREAVEYVGAFVRTHPEVVRFFKFVDVPDELFFQTIIMNSPLRRRVVNDNLRYIDWKDPDGASPSVLTIADFPRLAASPKLFARKFDATADSTILDLVDTQLLSAPGSVD